jgi:pimeloyl-ACP methyl ester carboxylesterase
MAVKKTYFGLFLCFDTIWLLKPYIHPVPAQGFKEYCRRLAFGFISGEALLIFSVVFWIVYFLFLIMGICRSQQVENWQHTGAAGEPYRIPFSLPTCSPKGKCIYLDGEHMPNHGKQPLILWPGFFQNGHVWDIIPSKGVKGSLAEYLWDKGFDIWMIHSRGTAGSSGRWTHCTMDDYAAYDIPYAIDYITGCTGQKPLYVGHSQGGKTAIISMMGLLKDKDGSVSLSEEEAEKRQSQVKGLVTLGCFLDLTHSSNPWLHNMVHKGIRVKVLGLNIPILPTRVLLFFCSLLRYLPMPVGIHLRRGLLRGGALKYALAPLYWIMELAACLKLWEFLYHIPNASKEARRHLFYRSQDGTFYGILNQLQRAVRQKAMTSYNKKINYSENYHRLTLPVSFVGMELDHLADPVNMEKVMFSSVSSPVKHFTLFKGQGHEDFFINPDYFPQVHEAIQKVNKGDI